MKIFLSRKFLTRYLSYVTLLPCFNLNILVLYKIKHKTPNVTY